MARRVPSLVAALALLGGLLVAAPVLALTFAPLLLLVVSLSAGVRPGERTLLRLRSRRLARRHHPGSRRTARPRLADVPRPAGHTLARALGMRPPPRAAASFR